MSKQTILIVEDEPMILFDLSLAVEDRGFAVRTATSCEEAMRQIAAERPAAAVLDVNLGKCQTCEPIANRLRDAGVPFFLHTGDLDRNGELLERLGARVISKPASSHYVASELAKLAGA